MDLARFLPDKPAWLQEYKPSFLADDAIAGLVLAVLLIPQAMAYALLAGLPPQAGLYAALAPPLLYLLFGTSPYVSVGPVALVSLIVGDAIAASGFPPMTAAMVIALEAGAMLVLVGLFRLGRLVNFVSEPVMLGFTAAAAVLIAASQLPTLLGLDVPRSSELIGTLLGLIDALPDLHADVVLIGLGALLLLLLGDRYAGPMLWKAGVRPPWRGLIVKAIPLLVLVGAAAMVGGSDLPVPRVGAVEGGLASLRMPPYGLDPWIALAPSALIAALVVFVIGSGVAKSLAGRNRRKVRSDREALALGMANIAAALTGGYAVGVSLSRSALTADSGSRSPISSVVASLVTLAVLLFLTGALAFLPKAALAALVISAVFGLVKLRAIKAVMRYSKVESAVLFATLAVTLLLGVQWGLAAGTLMGLAAFLWFSSVPRVTRVDRLDNLNVYRSIDRQDGGPRTLPVLIVRIDRSIYFGNAAYCEDAVLNFVSAHSEVRWLVLDMRSVNTIDASGMAMLERLLDNLQEKNVRVAFAAMHEPIAAALNASDRPRQARSFTTVEEAMHDIEEDKEAAYNRKMAAG